MKKNYFEPEMKVSKILLAQMIAASEEGGISEEPHEGGFGTKENILDGLFD